MRIAIVGAGVSGLGATWALNEHSDHQVELFEPGEWVGGHTNTVTFTKPQSTHSTPVDTGFIVFNKVTYPNFLRFLQHVGVEIINSEMSFAATRYDHLPSPKSVAPLSNIQPSHKSKRVRGSFEWAGSGPLALFCQPLNFFNPSHWRMVWDIIRFNQQAVEYLRQTKNHSKEDESSIGKWLDQRGYSLSFRKNYLAPMTASIWSTAPSTALSSFPAITLLRFMHNHHLLQILDRPQWLTIKNGSKMYVDRILSKLSSGRLHRGLDGEIVSIRKDGDGWVLKNAQGNENAGKFDKVIFACHADTTVQILSGALAKDDPVMKTLSCFQFSDNVAVLHTDEKLMPVNRQAWSAWNFLAETESVAGGEDIDRVSLTYWMNLLQDLPTEKYGPILVTLNPSQPETSPFTPDPKLVLRTQRYSHPLYTPSSVAAQTKLHSLQGHQGLYFAGAWTNYGFHEDGFSSGLKAASSSSSVQLPFTIHSAERTIPSSITWNVILVETIDGLAKSIPVVFIAQAFLLLAIQINLFIEFFFNVFLLKVSDRPLESFTVISSLRTVRKFWEDARMKTVLGEL